jgi:heme exporter protein CcmD
VIALIDNAGYIYGSYAITFAVVGAYAWRVVRQGRQLGRQFDDDDKYWT